MDAWDRQPDEPMLWFERFERYRLAGPARSIRAVHAAETAATAEDGGGQKGAKGGKRGQTPAGSWDRAAVQWRGRERAAAWNLAEIERERLEFEQERIKNKRTRRRLITSAQLKVGTALQDVKLTKVTLPQAVNALATLNREARAEYDDEPVQKIEAGEPGAFAPKRPKSVIYEVPADGPAENLED